jgi:hypothetical protein
MKKTIKELLMLMSMNGLLMENLSMENKENNINLQQQEKNNVLQNKQINNVFNELDNPFIKDDLIKIPIFMAHGLYDNVIDIQIADRSFEKLKARFNSANFEKYPMGHEVCEKEIDDLLDSIKKSN